MLDRERTLIGQIETALGGGGFSVSARPKHADVNTCAGEKAARDNSAKNCASHSIQCAGVSAQAAGGGGRNDAPTCSSTADCVAFCNANPEMGLDCGSVFCAADGKCDGGSNSGAPSLIEVDTVMAKEIKEGATKDLTAVKVFPKSSCELEFQGKNLGAFTSADQCAKAASGQCPMFMFSQSHPIGAAAAARKRRRSTACGTCTLW